MGLGCCRCRGKQGEAEGIKQSFEPILNSLGAFFQEAGGEVVKDEFMKYANDLCLPGESGNDYG